MDRTEGVENTYHFPNRKYGPYTRGIDREDTEIEEVPDSLQASVVQTARIRS